MWLCFVNFLALCTRHALLHGRLMCEHGQPSWPQVTFSPSATWASLRPLLEEGPEQYSVFRHPLGSGLCSRRGQLSSCTPQASSCTATPHCQAGWQDRLPCGRRLAVETAMVQNGSLWDTLKTHILEPSIRDAVRSLC